VEPELDGHAQCRLPPANTGGKWCGLVTSTRPA
jgi:hypothetical protein